MLALAQPVAANQRLLRQGGAGNDVGGRDRALDVVGDMHVEAEMGEIAAGEALGQRLGAGGRAAPDRHFADRAHRGMGADQMRGQRAGADHQQAKAVGARQKARGQRRGRCGAPPGQRRAVHQRQHFAGLGRQQQILADHRRQVAPAIVGKHGDDLDAEMAAVAPGGHQQQGGVCAVRPDRMVMAQRHVGAVAEQGGDGLDQRRIAQQPLDRGGIELAHGGISAAAATGRPVAARAATSAAAERLSIRRPAGAASCCCGSAAAR